MDKFRKIPSLKFLYEINSDGVIRNIKSKKELTPYCGNSGYYRIAIHNKSIDIQHFLIHRLVAECWCKIPEHLSQYDFSDLCVNHIDGNKFNNNYKNLEWVLSFENTRHAVDNGLLKESEKWGKQKFPKKPVKCVEYDLDFASSYQAAEWLIKKKSYHKKYSTVANGIREAARKRKKTAYGYHWEYI